MLTFSRYLLPGSDVRQQLIAGLSCDAEPEDDKAPGNPKLSASMTGAGWGLAAREQYFPPDQSSRKKFRKNSIFLLTHTDILL